MATLSAEAAAAGGDLDTPDPLIASKGVSYALRVFSSACVLSVLLEAERAVASAPHPPSLFEVLEGIVWSPRPHLRPWPSHDDAPFFNAEVARLAGLELLCVLCACLDSLLFLDARLGIMSRLQTTPAPGATVSSGGTVVFDQESLYWARLNVSVSTLGGPRERRLPPLSLEEYLSQSQSIGPAAVPAVNHVNNTSFWIKLCGNPAADSSVAETPAMALLFRLLLSLCHTASVTARVSLPPCNHPPPSGTAMIVDYASRLGLNYPELPACLDVRMFFLALS